MGLAVEHARTLKMSDDVLCVRYSKHRDPAKLLVCVALLDSTVKVFFDDSLRFFLSLYGHKLPVMAMDISDDNALLVRPALARAALVTHPHVTLLRSLSAQVTASADKNVKLWGLDFGDCHRSLFAHADSVMAARFVKDSHLFFTAGKDGTVKVRSRACHADYSGRRLTPHTPAVLGRRPAREHLHPAGPLRRGVVPGGEPGGGLSHLRLPRPLPPLLAAHQGAGVRRGGAQAGAGAAHGGGGGAGTPPQMLPLLLVAARDGGHSPAPNLPRAQEEEKEEAATLAKDGAPEQGAAGKRSMESLRAAERLAEAVRLAEESRQNRAEHRARVLGALRRLSPEEREARRQRRRERKEVKPLISAPAQR